MRGKTIIISVAAILSVVLVSSTLFVSGVLDASQISLFSTPLPEPQADGGNVFMDPAKRISDYYTAGYQVGNTFQWSVNITGVTTGIFTYAINLTWNPAVLNFSQVVSYGSFLYQTVSPSKTSRNVKIYAVNYTRGTASIAETILGSYPGVTGQGRLFTVEFRVRGYGTSSITVNGGTGPTLPTELLDASGASITLFTTTNGYFKNKLNGDANGDKTVNVLDMGTLSGRWTGAPGALPYSRDVDCNDDGVINVLDMGVVSANWGRTAP